MLPRMRRKSISFALLVGMQAGAATLKTVWRFLKKLKIELSYNPAIALLGIYPRDTGVLFQRGTCTPLFIAALSTIAKVRKEPKFPSMDEWIKKMWRARAHTHTHTLEYYSTIKKNEILPFAITWIELEGIMLSEIREKQRSYDFIHVRTLRYKTDEHKGKEAKMI